MLDHIYCCTVTLLGLCCISPACNPPAKLHVAHLPCACLASPAPACCSHTCSIEGGQNARVALEEGGDEWRFGLRREFCLLSTHRDVGKALSEIPKEYKAFLGVEKAKQTILNRTHQAFSAAAWVLKAQGPEAALGAILGISPSQDMWRYKFHQCSRALPCPSPRRELCISVLGRHF